MKSQLQFARVLAFLLGAALLSMPAVAVQRIANGFRQDRQQRKEERREQRQQQKEHKPQGNRPGNTGGNRPPAATPPRVQPPPNRAPSSPQTGAQSNPRGRDFAPRGNRAGDPPFGGGAQASLDRLRNMSPQERERVLQNSQAFQSKSPEEQARIRQNFQRWDRMTPQQQQALRDREETWRRLTPEQREHVRTDVLPRWREMPSDRRWAIMQRLNVLQGMPEGARNERLNDPNFTRGMSPADQSMLRELARLRVGGSPEAPPPDQP